MLPGQQRAVANGDKLGRPLKMHGGMSSAMKQLREKGMGINLIAQELKIGVRSVRSVI